MTLEDAALLAFERRWYRRPGAKEQAILTELGMSTTRYYARLHRILDDPRALTIDPDTVRRLQRLRAARQAHRTG